MRLLLSGSSMSSAMGRSCPTSKMSRALALTWPAIEREAGERQEQAGDSRDRERHQPEHERHGVSELLDGRETRLSWSGATARTNAGSLDQVR